MSSSKLFTTPSSLSDLIYPSLSRLRYVQEAKREVEAIDQECSQLMEASSLLDAEAARNTDLILNLRKELREANSEVARLQTMIGKEYIQSNPIPLTSTYYTDPCFVFLSSP